MKKILLSLLILVVSMVSYAQERYTAQDWAFVGQNHNAYLSDIYTHITTNGLGGEGVMNHIKDYLISRANTSEWMDSAKTQAVYNINMNINAFGTLQNLYPGEAAAGLSPSEKSYLNQLFTMITNEKLAPGDMRRQVEALESKIYADRALNNTQLATLFCATNVAKYSHEYWTANKNNWAELDGGGPAAMASVGNGVGAADVGGAVGAAVATWMANAVPGAGQVAYGGAICIGAASASAAKAVENWVSSWW